MRNHSLTSALEQIASVGAPTYPPRLVASATRELTLRSATESAAFERKVRLSANAAAIVGAICVVWPILLLSMLHAFEPGSIPQPREASFPFPQFDRIFVGTGICQALCGALLLLGGLAVRQRRALGPKLIRASLLLALLYVVAFTVMFLPSAFTLSRPGATAFVFMAFAFFNSALWGFLLWLPLRFFSSPRVRMYCQSAAA